MPIAPNTGCELASRDPDRSVAILNQFKDYAGITLPGLSDTKVEEQKEASRRFAAKYSQHLHFDSMPDYNFFTSVDPNEEKYLLGVLVSSGATEEIRSLIHKLIGLVIESGLHLAMRDEISAFNMLDGRGEMTDLFGQVDKSRLYLAEEFKSCVIVKPDVGFHIAQFLFSLPIDGSYHPLPLSCTCYRDKICS